MAQSARPEDLSAEQDPSPPSNKSQVRRMFIASGRRTCCPELLDHPAGLRAPRSKSSRQAGASVPKTGGQDEFLI